MLALSSCVETDQFDTSTDNSVALVITANNIPSAALAESDRVGVYYGDNYQNVEYVIDEDGALTPVDEAIAISSTASHTITAYYPYDESRTSSAFTFDVADLETVETTYWAAATSSSSKFKLDFANIFAELTISSYYTNMDLEGVSDMTCTVVNTTTAGSIDLASGVVTSTSTDGATFEIGTTDDGSYADIILYVAPSDSTASVGFKFESEEKDYDYTYYPLSQDSEWLAGESYGYSVEWIVGYTPVESLTISQSDLLLKEADSYQLQATITAGATNTDVIWSSSNRSVAYVSESGSVTAIAKGSATITATSVDGGYTASCEVRAYGDGDVVATNITATQGATASTTIDKRLSFSATIEPLGVDQSLTFKSSDESVAVVSASGWLTGLKSGKTTISVTSVNNPKLTATCVVTVTEATAAMAEGDYLYSTSSQYVYSSTYYADEDLLGVIYKLYEDGVTGKVINLKTTTLLAWAPSTSIYTSTLLIANKEGYEDYLTDELAICKANAGYGLMVMKEAALVDSTLSSFPIFSFIASFNETTVDYTSVADDENWVWYLPGEGCVVTELIPAMATINPSIEAAGGTTVGGNLTTATECATTKYNYIVSSTSAPTTLTKLSVGGSALTSRAIMNFDLSK